MDASASYVEVGQLILEVVCVLDAHTANMMEVDIAEERIEPAVRAQVVDIVRSVEAYISAWCYQE